VSVITRIFSDQALLAITLIFGLPIVAVVGKYVVEVAKTLRKEPTSKETRKLDAEETELIQNIYHGLQRMEQRIEALETILMDRAGREIVHRD